jgi:putative transposase
MRLKHYDNDGRARFITFCTHKRLPILDDCEFRDLTRQALMEICRAQAVEILAYVIMPEHIHMVVVPPIALKLGPFIGELKRQTAKAILANLRLTQSPVLPSLRVIRDGTPKFAVWQRRCFDRNCRNETEVWQAVDYCHYNPVARGLVADPADWKWSSYRWYTGE